MKKSFAISVIILSLLLAACFKKKELVPQVTELPEKVSQIGVVYSSEEAVILNAPTKHFIENEARQRYFVESVLFNLDRYVGRKVSVSGTLREADQVVIIDLLDSLTPETQEKTVYRDAKLGISFAYPTIWNFEAKNDFSILITPYKTSDPTDRIGIERSENNKKLSARDWLALNENLQSQRSEDALANFQESFIGAHQLPAIKRILRSADGVEQSVEFYVPRDLFMYRFSHSTVNDADRDLYRNAFFDLVASFEFVPYDATPLQDSKAADSPTQKKPDAVAAAPAPTVAPNPPPPAEPIPAPVSAPAVLKNTDDLTPIELKPYKLSLHYPKKWYWAHIGNDFYFGNQPPEPGDANYDLILSRDVCPAQSEICYSVSSGGCLCMHQSDKSDFSQDELRKLSLRILSTIKPVEP